MFPKMVKVIVSSGMPLYNWNNIDEYIGLVPLDFRIYATMEFERNGEWWYKSGPCVFRRSHVKVMKVS